LLHGTAIDIHRHSSTRNSSKVSHDAPKNIAIRRCDWRTLREIWKHCGSGGNWNLWVTFAYLIRLLMSFLFDIVSTLDRKHEVVKHYLFIIIKRTKWFSFARCRTSLCLIDDNEAAYVFGTKRSSLLLCAKIAEINQGVSNIQVIKHCSPLFLSHPVLTSYETSLVCHKWPWASTSAWRSILSSLNRQKLYVT